MIHPNSWEFYRRILLIWDASQQLRILQAYFINMRCVPTTENFTGVFYYYGMRPNSWEFYRCILLIWDVSQQLKILLIWNASQQLRIYRCMLLIWDASRQLKILLIWDTCWELKILQAYFINMGCVPTAENFTGVFY